MFLATGRYAVLRGVSTDKYGDEVDSKEPVARNVLGSVLESQRTVFNPNDQRTTVVRDLVGRFGSGTDVQSGDRIRNEKSGDVYVVLGVHEGNGPVHKSDVVVDLTRNTVGG